MTGHPAHQQELPKRYAYLLFDVSEPTFRDGFDAIAREYVPQNPPRPGTLMARDDNPGTGTHVFDIEDGPWTWLCQGVYVGTGRELPDGNVEFDLGVKWLLDMVALGANKEILTKKAVHLFADQLKERLDGATGDPIAIIDSLETEFWKVR